MRPALPADVLIDIGGKALAVHYGSHAYDRGRSTRFVLALGAAPPPQPAPPAADHATRPG